MPTSAELELAHPISEPRACTPWAGLRARGALVAVVAAAAAALSAFEGGAAPDDVGRLAALLAAAAGPAHAVRPDDVRWEPSSGVVGDFVFGRFVLFLGSEAPGAPRDVYRARVRLSPEGKPLTVSSPSNLTATPLGDDHALVVRGARAAFATFAFRQQQSVTVLDLSGEGAQNVTTRASDRAMAWVTNLQRTGSGAGVGRVDVTLDQPAERVGLALGDRSLEIELADDPRAVRATRTASLDLERGELSADAVGMHAEAGTHLPKRLVFWAVDTVRAVPWIGPAPIAWLEERTFAVRDAVKQASFKVTSGSEALATVPEVDVPAAVLDGSQASADLGHWPPTDIRSMWKTPEPGEGAWVPPTQPWVRHVEAPEGAEQAPAAFYRTFVRPDEERPYAKVLLVAMDMRQLDLEMEAGNEDPKPLTGPPGTGRIPRDPKVYKRVAAAFNGGFKTEHGNYGMMLRRRVLLPPVPGAATVIVTRDGRFGLGTWGTNKDVGGVQDVDAADILSFRQNLDPLVDSDKVNPSGRSQWGFTLPGTTMQTERSGLCVTAAGHLMYAWGDDVSAITLGKAMKMGGCVYGMHLDMNPHHTGLIFTNIDEIKGRKYKSELLSTQMEIDTARYIEYAPKDFFYMTLHDGTPPAVAESDSGGAEASAWQPDPGVQPAPSWMPGLYRASVGDVELLDIEPARATFRVRAGTKEPDARTGVARSHELEADDAQRVLFALTLGIADADRPRGLATDGRVALAIGEGRARDAALVVSEDGNVDIVPSRGAAQVSPRTDVVELPLLFDESGPGPSEHARAPRAALGVAPSGRIFVARAREGKASASALAEVLSRAGCTRAVVLDRGAGASGVVARAGTGSPPRARYEESVLYAMGKALVPRGFRFTATNPVEPPAPKKK